jgi:transposase-like protein
MAKHRTHSVEFKQQVSQEYLAGETLHALAKRHDISRNLIRIWVEKFQAGALDEGLAAGVERLNEIVQPLKTIRSFCVADSSNFAIVPAFENKTADMCRASACPKKSVGTTLSPTTWSLNFFSTPYLLPSSA